MLATWRPAQKKLYAQTCGAVTLPASPPACMSISQAYSNVSLPRGRPWAENMAWALIWRPDRLRWPSLNTPSAVGRCGLNTWVTHFHWKRTPQNWANTFTWIWDYMMFCTLYNRGWLWALLRMSHAFIPTEKIIMLQYINTRSETVTVLRYLIAVF